MRVDLLSTDIGMYENERSLRGKTRTVALQSSTPTKLEEAHDTIDP